MGAVSEESKTKCQQAQKLGQNEIKSVTKVMKLDLSQR